MAVIAIALVSFLPFPLALLIFVLVLAWVVNAVNEESNR